MNGLKEEIRCDMKLMHPQNLKQAMNFASQVEHKNRVKEKYEEKQHQMGKIATGPM